MTRRQWLFQNPPPQTAERFTFELQHAKEELRAAMAETGAVVLEMFAAAAIQARKAAAAGIKEKVKGFFAERKQKRKLLELAHDVAHAIQKHTNGEEFEKRGAALLERLDQFQIEQSRELVHALNDARLWRQKIVQLKEAVAGGAKCPLDDAELQRVANRKEDLFICTAPIVEDRAQHYFLWTQLEDGAAGFREVDLAKDPLPDLDGPIQGSQVPGKGSLGDQTER